MASRRLTIRRPRKHPGQLDHPTVRVQRLNRGDRPLSVVNLGHQHLLVRIRRHLSQMGDHAPLFAAYVDGSPVAFLWVAVSADIAYELYGGMNEDGQRLRANYALKWHVIRKMKEWGLSEYDFGGLVAGGVANFKQGWTDEMTVLPGTFDRPLSPLYPVWNKALPGAKKIVQTVKRRFN